ncbi:MAG: PAS domain S-box protein [Marinobacter sp.]|nr:PAS domain S-box protein [Marinobacter sp.]
MTSRSIERKVLTGFVLAVAVLAGSGLVLSIMIMSYSQASQGNMQATESLLEVERLLSRTHEMESAHRGYLITGNQQYLRERQEALQQIQQLSQSIDTETDVPRSLAPELRKLEAATVKRVNLLNEVLALHNSEGFEAARERLEERPGSNEMALARNLVAQIVSEERERLSQRARQLQVNSQWLIVAFPIVVLAAVLFLFLLYREITREIGERRRAEAVAESRAAALRESQERVRAVVETAIDAIITIDAKGGIASINPATEKLFGYVENELIGHNVSMLMPEPMRSEHDGYIQHYLETGERRIIGIGREVTALHRDGRHFPVELSVSEIHVNGQRMFSGTLRNITERKQAEREQKRLVKDLMAANEELKNFAYVVSHDLKAPLRAIGSLADWISTDYADQFDEDGRENMQLLMGRVRRMDRLIDGILEYSRVGRVTQHHQTIDLNDLVGDVVDLLAPPESVRVEIADLPSIEGEQTRVHQIFQNLIGNALQYMDKPEGMIRIDCQSRGDLWQFSVSDNGPGIDPRHFDRIFQLFQTLAPKDRIESTGIGLAMIKKIVELAGGEVWLTSEPGRGSTFFFTWPKR